MVRVWVWFCGAVAAVLEVFAVEGVVMAVVSVVVLVVVVFVIVVVRNTHLLQVRESSRLCFVLGLVEDQNAFRCLVREVMGI